MFRSNAGLELLAFTCALVASSIWLMIATRRSWPVSTTYSIVSALAGVGVAIGGPNAVNWGWNNGKGLATIFAGMAIAPALAAGFAACVFLITKYAVLVRKDSTRAGLIASPIYFFGVTAILTLSIVYKGVWISLRRYFAPLLIIDCVAGAPRLGLSKLSQPAIAAAILGTSGVVAALSILFWLPFVYCKVVRKDYSGCQRDP